MSDQFDSIVIHATGDPGPMPPLVARRLDRRIRREVWRRRLRRVLRLPWPLRALLASRDPEFRMIVRPWTEEEVLEFNRFAAERHQAEGEGDE